MSIVVSVKNATKRFGDTQALRGAELTLSPGEWLGLLGPNGAGKTTLVRAIAGRVRLDAGEITLFDTNVTGSGTAARAARQKLGWVPQDIALYEALSARENLEVFGRFHGLARARLRQRVDWALQWIGLADRAAGHVRTFSGGMKRRLNIGCGVLHQPEVLLLDEPTVGVDPQSRQRIWEMLDHLRREGTSLLLTTHQLDEAQTVCGRIVIIDHGTVIANGTLNELVERTVGRDRIVSLTLDRPAEPGVLGENVQVTGSTLRCRVSEVVAELPPLLERVRAAGFGVADIQVESPSLHNVFLHLTGKELRE